MSRLLVVLSLCVPWAWASLGCSGNGAGNVPGVELDDAAANDTETTDVGAAGDVAVTPGAPRLPCVDRSKLANDLPIEVWGALEGELVSVVPPGTPNCPADGNHLHLQIAVADKRYDVAVTIDSDIGAPVAMHVHTLPATTIAPGWMPASFDYEQDLGVSSTEYEPLAPGALVTRLSAALRDATRVRIYGRSYVDGTGVHNVHRNGRGRDGVILVHAPATNPSAGDRALALRFAQDTF